MGKYAYKMVKALLPGGRAVVEAMEQRLLSDDKSVVVMRAVPTAVSFYSHLGYKMDGRVQERHAALLRERGAPNIPDEVFADIPTIEQCVFMYKHETVTPKHEVHECADLAEFLNRFRN